MKREIKDSTREIVKAFAREMYNQVPPLRILNVCGYLVERYCCQHAPDLEPRVFGAREWERGEEIPELKDLHLTIEEMLADGTVEIKEGSEFFSLVDQTQDLTETQAEAVKSTSSWLLGKDYTDARKWIQENSNTWRVGWPHIQPHLDITSWEDWCEQHDIIKSINKEVEEVFEQLAAEGKIPAPKK